MAMARKIGIFRWCLFLGFVGSSKSFFFSAIFFCLRYTLKGHQTSVAFFPPNVTDIQIPAGALAAATKWPVAGHLSRLRLTFANTTTKQRLENLQIQWPFDGYSGPRHGH
eukprot:GABV01014640.1.p2 GENE.GABV01014640.1~~GABV01014640.1.p2  ORF type:complete len:110 (-),score=22.77 GABV01014640.1:11-340(-)